MSGNEERITAVLLDMGGVLIDTRGTAALPGDRLDHRGRRALLGLLRAHGVRKVSGEQLDRELFEPWHHDYAGRYERMRDAAWEPHLARLRASTGTGLDDLTMLASWFGPYAETLKPLPGARRAIAALRTAGYRTGLVSNVPLPGALYRPALEAAGLIEQLEVTRFSYDAGSRKPSPRMLHEVLAALGAEPRSAVMVGDRRASDVAAGRAAGMRTVWLRSEFSDGPAADADIDSIADLPALLDRWS
jgi:HAD superfamily hydrolase (TIGR01509 family)